MLQAFLATQKENASLWLPILLGIGIALYFGLDFEPRWWGGLVVWLALTGLAIGSFRINFPIAIILAGLSIIALGWCAAQLRVERVAAPVLEKSMMPVTVEGTIRTLDSLEKNKGSRIVLENLVIDRLTPEKTPHTVRISIRKDEGLQAGQRVRVLAGLNPPAAPIEPEGFDFQRHAYFHRIGGYGFAYKAPEILEVTPASGLERFRQQAVKKIESAIPHPEAAIVSALLLGKRTAIPEETWEDIRTAGLAHVISISGLHISMISLGIFFAARLLMALIPPLALAHPIKKYAALLALAGGIAYSVMVGLSIPTVRAMIMTGLVLTAIMLDRNPFSLRLVAFAAFLILLFQPESITNPGFQMSFAAVASLIFFYEQTRNFWTSAYRKEKNRWLWRLALGMLGTAMTSIVATIATTPFTLYHFQQFPIYSVVGNIAALPFISFITMPAAVIAYLLMPLGWEFPAIWVMGKGVSAMLVISAEIASWNYASPDMVTWPLGALLSFTIAGLWIIMLKGRLRWGALLPCLAGIIFVMAYKPPDILVASNAKLVMIRADDKTAWLSTRRRDKFTAQNWLRASGINANAVHIWPQEGKLEKGDASLSCDPQGCLLALKGKTIAFSYAPEGFAEDCLRADVIIITYYARGLRCQSNSEKNVKVIRRWNLNKEGAHSLAITPSGAIEINTVAGKRGNRPWTAAGSGR